MRTKWHNHRLSIQPSVVPNSSLRDTETERDACREWLLAHPSEVMSTQNDLPGSSVRGDSPGKNTGVGCPALLQGISQTQGWSLHLLRLLHLAFRWILYLWVTGEAPLMCALMGKWWPWVSHPPAPIWHPASGPESCRLWTVSQTWPGQPGKRPKTYKDLSDS